MSEAGIREEAFMKRNISVLIVRHVMIRYLQANRFIGVASSDNYRITQLNFYVILIAFSTALPQFNKPQCSSLSSIPTILNTMTFTSRVESLREEDVTTACMI